MFASVYDPCKPWKSIGNPSVGYEGEITLLLALMTLPPADDADKFSGATPPSKPVAAPIA